MGSLETTVAVSHAMVFWWPMLIDTGDRTLSYIIRMFSSPSVPIQRQEDRQDAS